MLLSSSAYALSMGSIAKNDFAEITSGESAKFEALFWNPENESYKVVLSASFPDRWTVILDPKDFILNNSVGEEYISVSHGNVRAKRVNVFVKPDEKSVSGNYTITVWVDAISSENSSLTVIPRRSFNLIVELKGLESEEHIDEIEMPYVSEDVNQETVVEHENGDEKIFYIAVIGLIILISIIVYKKS